MLLPISYFILPISKHRPAPQVGDPSSPHEWHVVLELLFGAFLTSPAGSAVLNQWDLHESAVMGWVVTIHPTNRSSDVFFESSPKEGSHNMEESVRDWESGEACKWKRKGQASKACIYCKRWPPTSKTPMSDRSNFQFKAHSEYVPGLPLRQGKNPREGTSMIQPTLVWLAWLAIRFITSLDLGPST